MKKIVTKILSILLVCSFLAGCSVEVKEEKEKSGQKYYIYYLNKDATALKKEKYEPEQETADFMLKDLMQRLNNKSAEGSRIDLLPEEVEMTSYNIADTVLVIDFNGNYAKMSKAREILVRAGVVKTFLQISGVSSVQFTVNGEALTDSRDQAVGSMNNTSFMELNGSDPDAYCYGTFTLYFTDKTGKNLVEEQRTVRYRRSIPKERVILEQLMKGPMEKGHYPTIPENTGILDVTIADRICYITVDNVFSDYALDVADKIPIYSVVNSILSGIEADKVQITVGDDKEGTFREKMPLYRFYEKKEDIVVNGEEKQ